MTDIGVVHALERLVVAGVALVLGGASDGPTISQVLRRIGVTLPAISRQLRRLVRRGLVEISRDESIAAPCAYA